MPATQPMPARLAQRPIHGSRHHPPCLNVSASVASVLLLDQDRVASGECGRATNLYIYLFYFLLFYFIFLYLIFFYFPPRKALMVLIVHAGYNGACTGIYCVRATPKRPYLEAVFFYALDPWQ
jgi:hypothetical protein